MAYTHPQDVRDLLGLDVDQAEDSLLAEFLTKAQYVVLKYVQVSVIDEEVDLDSSGTTFSVANAFIADIDFDASVGTADIKVYGWSDADHIDSRVELTVSTLWPNQGLIKLSADASGYEKITIDYSYYTAAIDWNLMGMATAYYAGMLWVAREEFLVPDELTIGGIRVKQKQPWDKIRAEFLRLIYHMTQLPMDRVTYDKMVISGRSGEKYAGPGTTYQEDDSHNWYNEKDIV